MCGKINHAERLGDSARQGPISPPISSAELPTVALLFTFRQSRALDAIFYQCPAHPILLSSIPAPKQRRQQLVVSVNAPQTSRIKKTRAFNSQDRLY